MKGKRRAANIVSMIFTFVMIIIIVSAKLSYYIPKFKSFGFDSRDAMSNLKFGITWTSISILISLFPMIVLTLSNIFKLKDEKYKNESLILLISSFLFLGLNILLELISCVGAAMTLSTAWGNIALEMIGYHFLSLSAMIPAVISVNRKE